MFAGQSKRDSDSSDESLGQLELEVEEAYIADRTKSVARLDKESMRMLRISAGDGVIIFAGERPVMAKVFPLYPSDTDSGVIRINQFADS